MPRLPAAFLYLVLAGCTTQLATGGGDDDDAGSLVDAGPLAAPDAYCEPVPVSLSLGTASVVFMIDRADTMNQSFGGSSRWDSVYTSLFHFSDGLITNVADEVRFGLSLYSGNGGNPICPIVSELAPKIDNNSQLSGLFQNSNPIEHRPTGEALSATAGKLASTGAGGAKAIILATDGNPDTCAALGADGSEDAIRGATNAAEVAYNDGIQTHVIAIGTGASADYLQSLSNAGAGKSVGGSVNAPYRTAQNQSELDNAFAAALADVRACTFTMDRGVNPASASSGTVRLDGVELEYGSDWGLVDANTLRLPGDACASIKASSGNVEAEFACATLQ
jgi:hypothetical protein